MRRWRRCSTSPPRGWTPSRGWRSGAASAGPPRGAHTHSTRPGPGRPATALMPELDVGGTQKVATAFGKFGSGEPVATMGSRKQARRSTSVQLPASTPTAPAEAALPAIRFASQQRYLRGLFSGGTFCTEAQVALRSLGITSRSNVPLDAALALAPFSIDGSGLPGAVPGSNGAADRFLAADGHWREVSGAGTRWWHGEGPPEVLPQARSGDFYLDGLNGEVYVLEEF